MRNRLVWASAAALVLSVQLAAASGVIMISTRAPQDTGFSTEFVTDERGPGMATPGDVAMASLLHDNGYTCRLILDKLLGDGASLIGRDKSEFLEPLNTNMAPILMIMSGSGASADTPPPPPGIPVMMGEHVCLGNNAARAGSIYMYAGTSSSDPNEGTGATKYMKVVAPDHPILKGIPLDSQGRIKIFRDQYPEEELNVPPGGKRNYEYRWCTQLVADAAPATTILGVLDDTETRACFAVAEKGGLLANGEQATARLVHMFVNEQGSGGSRRVFLALTSWGRLLFLRAAKWAMGEELPPYQPIRIEDVTAIDAQKVRMSWIGSATKNYLIAASVDAANWQTVIEDIPGQDGVMTRTLDISAGPSAVFLRVGALP